MARPGFERLVASLCAGEIGAVLCLDASRLARNGRDWLHLLELCGFVEARVIDLYGVYDPGMERLIGLSALDSVAVDYADDMGTRTFTLFLAAKSMNAALSVLENASMSFGAVMSVAVVPGKVLEPVDDLIEQFSVALLGASGAVYLLKSLALLGGAERILRHLAPAGLLLLQGETPRIGRVASRGRRHLMSYFRSR